METTVFCDDYFMVPGMSLSRQPYTSVLALVKNRWWPYTYILISSTSKTVYASCHCMLTRLIIFSRPLVLSTESE